MARVAFTHLERVFWPETGWRKRDLVEYYRALAPVLVPHLRGRPFTIKRHYTVPRGPFEWVKDAPPELPSWIRTCPQPAKSRRGALVRYPLVNSRDALLWMVEYGAVDLHVWSSRCDRPDRPDYVLFDLDPRGAPFAAVVREALRVREVLAEAGLESLVRTTGGDGLHVLVPIARRYTHEQTRRFAGVVARYTKEEGVSVDVKMNGHGQQVVAGYSVRPLPGAPVATPLRWDEVLPGLDPREFTRGVVARRVEREGDLAAGLLTDLQELAGPLARLGAG
jgi:bifunctional non-homologous end joining protein LigD